MNRFYQSFLKRLLDILLSLMAIVIFFPFFLLSLFILLLTGHQKLFFTQTRVGLHEKKFRLYKLCTMTEEKDDKGVLLPDEKRLTAAGRFIRKTSMDELPQLLNVLMGDMSIVGPRPLLVEYLSYYSPEQKKRHLVRPGITGWAQVNGRNAISWERKFELDVWYVTHLSLILDIRILLLTIRNVLFAKQISQEGHATMTPFRGRE